MADRGERFFDQPQLPAALDALATSDRIVIVAGAGVSAQSGLPTWNELTRRLLVDLARSKKLDKAERVAFAERTRAAEPGLLAPTLIQALHGDAFPDALRRSLYRAKPTWQEENPAPGSTALAIAEVVAASQARGAVCEVVTTNYDDLLEQALQRRLGRKVLSLCDGSPSPKRRVAVRHLHGLLTPTRAEGDLVWGEGPYVDTASPQSWQEQFFQERLSEAAVVFVGVSFTDPNLVRWLHRFRKRAHPVVAIVNQRDPHEEGSTRSSALHAQMADARFAAMGLTVLRADWRHQPAQFLHEVAARSRLGPDYRPYRERLDDWYGWYANDLLGTGDATLFAHRQRLLSDGAGEVVRRVRRRLELTSRSGEDLLIQLWTRYPPERALAMTVASDRAWRNKWVLDRRPIGYQSRITAIDAFCEGSIQIRSIRLVAQQWRYVYAMPLVLDGPFGPLPVGAAMIASSRDHRSSRLAKLPTNLRTAIAAEVHQFFTAIVTPDP